MKNDDEDMVYDIPDKKIANFIDSIRRIVFSAFGEGIDEQDQNQLDELINSLTQQDEEELDKTLTYDECLNILHYHVKPKKTRSGKIRYLFSEDQCAKIIEDVNARLVSNLLTSLVAEGKVESAYSEEDNDFIFWVKDNEEKEDE